MPVDAYSARFGNLCLRCGTEERKVNFTACEACLSVAKRDEERRLAALAAEVMQWRPQPTYPQDPNPARLCGRCSQAHTVWTTRNERLVCGLCGWSA
jgi:hypothetical protein